MSDARTFQRLKEKGLNLNKIFKKMEISEGDNLRVEYGEGKVFEATYLKELPFDEFSNHLYLSFNYSKGLFKRKEYFLKFEESYDPKTTVLYEVEFESIENIEKIKA